jgi:hypothetical protein
MRESSATTHNNVTSDNFLFTVDSIFLSVNILDAFNKKGNCQLFMNQDSRSRHSCNTATYLYLCHREQRHGNKNITFNDTFHFLSLQANKTCMLCWCPIIYDKCNLQRLGSDIHLVMCHTKMHL